MDRQLTHLTLIQGIISRMGSNSFLLKGWSVTLVAAIFALAAKDSDQRFVLLAYFPIFVFWGLDAFFLHQERLYRALYVAVASNQVSSEHLTLDATPFAKNLPSAMATAFSKTLLPFHGVIGLMVLFGMFVLMR